MKKFILKITSDISDEAAFNLNLQRPDCDYIFEANNIAEADNLVYDFISNPDFDRGDAETFYASFTELK